MRIIILGAGQVGSSVATHLVREGNDITVVDTDARPLRDLENRLDLRAVQGYASYPDVLVRAGAEGADMLLAVTGNDETNLVACRVAATLFRIPTKIARVNAMEYLGHPQLVARRAFAAEVLISPQQLVSHDVRRLIEFPGSLQVLDFAGGRVQLVAIRAYHDGPLVGCQLRTLGEHMPDVQARVVAIFRRDTPIIPQGDTVIEAGDEVFLLAPREHVRAAMGELRRLDRPNKRIMIAGGGRICRHLARELAGRYQLKVIEKDPARATRLSEELDKALVLQGDAADPELLEDEGIESIDVFCALTNDDEDNILSATLAKRLGARKAMALINRSAYVDLLQSGSLDVAISPAQITIGTLLRHIRRGHVVAVHSLRRGAAEAIEVVAHGDRASSRVVGHAICDVPLPPDTVIGAIVRGEEVIIAHHDTMIQPDDHVILFVADRKRIHDIERLFQAEQQPA